MSLRINFVGVVNMFCTNCGAEIKENDVFCMSCGQKIGYNSGAVNQAAENLSYIVGKKYSFTWKSYSLARFPLSIILYQRLTNTIELKEDRIDIIGPDKLLGNSKFIKSINYNDISDISCDVKPFNTALGWIITIVSILSAFAMAGGNALFDVFLAIILCYTVPIWSRSVIKPVHLIITEKNGNKTKFKGEKDCIQAAEEATKNINILISK